MKADDLPAAPGEGGGDQLFAGGHVGDQHRADLGRRGGIDDVHHQLEIVGERAMVEVVAADREEGVVDHQRLGVGDDRGYAEIRAAAASSCGNMARVAKSSRRESLASGTSRRTSTPRRAALCSARRTP